MGGNYTLNFDQLNADDDGLKNGFNDRFLSLETIFEHFLALAPLRRILPVCTAHYINYEKKKKARKVNSAFNASAFDYGIISHIIKLITRVTLLSMSTNAHRSTNQKRGI